MEKTEIPALVITGLTIEEEMKIFVKQDELRTRISGSDIYNAGKNLPGSLDNRLFHICQATGVHCVDSSAKTSIAGPRAYSAYRKAIKLHGDDIVQKVFTLYKQCKHTNDTTLYNRYMFDALINLVTDKNVEYNAILDALNTFETIGEIYNAANQANMYAYANNVDLTNVIRGRIKILAKKKEITKSDKQLRTLQCSSGICRIKNNGKRDPSRINYINARRPIKREGPS